MAVTPEDVRHVAGLARLDLADGEAESLTRELNGILEHMEALSQVDTAGAGGDDDVARPAPLRPDEPGADPLAHGPESLAPSWEDGFFTVPRLAALDQDALEGEGAGG